jgi:uncharacterized Fe-S center protein
MNQTNILNDFTKRYSGPEEMYEQISKSFEESLSKDREMKLAIEQIAVSLMEYGEFEVVSKEKMDEVVEGSKDKKSTAELRDRARLDGYSFVVYTLLRNLEHAGLIKVYSKPERITMSAINQYERERNKKEKNKR